MVLTKENTKSEENRKEIPQNKIRSYKLRTKATQDQYQSRVEERLQKYKNARTELGI